MCSASKDMCITKKYIFFAKSDEVKIYVKVVELEDIYNFVRLFHLISFRVSKLCFLLLDFENQFWNFFK